jgi:hypothetical protein
MLKKCAYDWKRCVTNMFLFKESRNKTLCKEMCYFRDITQKHRNYIYLMSDTSQLFILRCW